jgi:hypothetical protein
MILLVVTLAGNGTAPSEGMQAGITCFDSSFLVQRTFGNVDGIVGSLHRNAVSIVLLTFNDIFLFLFVEE